MSSTPCMRPTAKGRIAPMSSHPCWAWRDSRHGWIELAALASSWRSAPPAPDWFPLCRGDSAPARMPRGRMAPATCASLRCSPAGGWPDPTPGAQGRDGVSGHASRFGAEDRVGHWFTCRLPGPQLALESHSGPRSPVRRPCRRVPPDLGPSRAESGSWHGPCETLCSFPAECFAPCRGQCISGS